VLYYAPGGGLGHLTRGLALLHTLGVRNARLLVGSIPIPDLCMPGYSVICMQATTGADLNTHRSWLLDQIEAYTPGTLMVDTFPVGICGELTDLFTDSRFSLWYIARRLRWDRYVSAGLLSHREFDVTARTEPLDPAQQQWVEIMSRSVFDCPVTDPPVVPGGDVSRLESFIRTATTSVWMLVHSGPLTECRELLEYARKVAFAHNEKPVYVFCSAIDNLQIDGAEVFKVYPVWPLYPLAGFNEVRQGCTLARRYNFLPFERYFDDQFARCALTRNAASLQTQGSI
jgi:hypothetical protein